MPRYPSASPTAGRATLLERALRTPVVRGLFGLPLVQRALSPARGDRAIHKFIRYSMVSGVAIVISQLTILVCTALFHTSGILANTLGAIAATPASYELNRRWAWGKRGKSHLWKEVVPFWSLTLLGYLGSTGTVQLADNICKSDHVTGLDRSLAIMGASLFAYGVVWVAKFLIFHHLVFGRQEGVAGALPSDAGVASPAEAAGGEPAATTAVVAVAAAALAPQLSAGTHTPVGMVGSSTGAAATSQAAVPAFEGPSGF